MDSRQLWQMMNKSGAVWEYPKDARAPHVILRSGLHSNGLIDALQFLSQVKYLELAAEALTDKLRQRIRTKIDWVFGSPMAGIPFATAVARHLGVKHIGFTEKIGEKDLICRFNLEPADSFLMIEEMTTTGATPRRGIEAVLKKNPRAMALNWVGACLARCGPQPEELKSGEIISLVSLPELNVHYSEWFEGDCPLCKTGSRAIKDCKRVWPSLLRTMTDPTFPIA
ncbi:MAG: hypothetical protein AAB455_01665 [Patescibacteria group bacterium]